ncbi:MAG: TatD family hydrolase [Gammaproteobacteria bacterium]|nr:TatD family hydrolase [Gammaproteobacteria bacterium]MBQ0840258.1 TatD family hydrolase [Gammaproteobacteria bacterium]
MSTEQEPHPLIDIGLNLADKRFRGETHKVLEHARDAGVSACILTATSESISHEVIELCERYAEEFPAMLSCTAGVHPHDAKHWHKASASVLKELASHEAVVAIGETGLDFNRDFSPRAQQEQAFEAQLELASELQLPVFLHERDAHKRQLEILHSYRDHLVDAVIHCFTGDKKALFNYLDLDLHIGITGWICDERRGLELQKMVKNIPLQRLMLETDAPYLTPRTLRPKPKSSRNEPAYLPWVLDSVAQYRDESAQIIAHATSTTSQRFFRLNS